MSSSGASNGRSSNKSARKHRVQQRKESKGDRTLPAELLKECQDAFSMFDKNGDGTITFDELTAVMRLLGNNPTDGDLRAIMASLDADKNGEVDFEEFQSIVSRHWKEPVDEEAELRSAFKVFDRNDDGFVVAEEIQFVMAQLGHDLSEDEVRDTIKSVDVNGDGKLDYHEFVKVMQSDRMGTNE